MYWNYLKIALRNLRKNKLFAVINIIGLAIGLTIYVFVSLLIEYEKNHDLFFENNENIYTIMSVFNSGMDLPFDQMNSASSAYAPIIDAELADVESVARTRSAKLTVNINGNSQFERITFADPVLLNIFSFEYLYGDRKALENPDALVVTEAAAIRLFGTADAVGQVVLLNNQESFQVTAIIKDIPLNSHFNTTSGKTQIFAPIGSLQLFTDFDFNGRWRDIWNGNITYIQLPSNLDSDWLDIQLESIYQRHVSDYNKGLVSSIHAQPLWRANYSNWETVGGVSIDLVFSVLSLLIITIACINYTNLAAAQSLGRSREVGIRKTMGASRTELLCQFLVESILVSAVAMIIAITILELIIPLFNNATNKVMQFKYLETMPWLLGTTLAAGLVTGIYPSWLITKVTPIDALRDVARKGKYSTAIREFMIGLQFSISTFLIAAVVVVYAQNEKAKEDNHLFPRQEVYVLNNINSNEDKDNVDLLQLKLDLLQNELNAIPNVKKVAFSNLVPYSNSYPTQVISTVAGDTTNTVKINQLGITPSFFDVYDIPLLAGRHLNGNISNDKYHYNVSKTLNIILNDQALDKLGIETPEQAINTRLYSTKKRTVLREYVVVGVASMPSFIGVTGEKTAWFFYVDPTSSLGSIRFMDGSDAAIVDDIKSVWKKIFPAEPMEGEFLSGIFNENFKFFVFLNAILAGFSLIALIIAMVGLFGLSAFIAAQRTKEVGMRKVLGASSIQISKLLIWQFSKPVLWAVVSALMFAFFASNKYLQYFSDRIEYSILLLLLAGIFSVVLGWITVGAHAYKLARENPIIALRHE